MINRSAVQLRECRRWLSASEGVEMVLTHDSEYIKYTKLGRIRFQGAGTPSARTSVKTSVLTQKKERECRSWVGGGWG